MSEYGSPHVVIYDYDATTPDELTIRVGETVYVMEELDKGWVRGFKDDEIGMFPAAYVEAADSVDSGASTVVAPVAKVASTIEGGASSAETAQVVEEFQTKDPAHLPLLKDQLVIVFRKFPTGWASGECAGKTGMFPLKNVRLLDFGEAATLRAISSSPTLSTASTSKKAANKEKRMSRIRSSTLTSTTREEMEEDDMTPGTPATVLFAYTAADKGQLSLISGETIQVLDKLSGGWWKGRNDDGDVGFFPGSYVRENLSTASPQLSARDSISSNGGLSSSNSSTNVKRTSTVSKPSLKKATALFKYVAKSSSELSFDVGDEVLVFPVKDGESSGWWTGALTTAPTVVAHFPASYVRLVGGVADDPAPTKTKEDKASKRKSQPASRPVTVSTPSIGTLGRSGTKPPMARPPPRPSEASIPEDPTSSKSGEISQETGSLSPRDTTPRSARSNGNGAGMGSSADADALARHTEQANKTAEQAKTGLVKLQQQSKAVFDGMLQRLDAADKDRARLEHAMREMHKLLQAGEAQRTKLAQQNQVLYQQVTELKTQLSMEATARTNLEARLSKLEQGR